MKNKRKSVSGWKRIMVLNRQGWVCTACGDPIHSPKECEIDHIRAFRHGGGNGINNLSALCPECNKDKTLLEHSLRHKPLNYNRIKAVPQHVAMMVAKVRDLKAILAFTPEYAYSHRFRIEEYYKAKRWVKKNRRKAQQWRKVNRRQKMSFIEILATAQI